MLSDDLFLATFSSATDIGLPYCKWLITKPNLTQNHTSYQPHTQPVRRQGLDCSHSFVIVIYFESFYNKAEIRSSQQDYNLLVKATAETLHNPQNIKDNKNSKIFQ